jgi:hypothetical protein
VRIPHTILVGFRRKMWKTKGQIKKGRETGPFFVD